MNLSKKISAKFETKMHEKGWSFEKDETGKQYLDAQVQAFYEIFFHGYMSAPVHENGFYVIARITPKGLQFGQTPYIHKYKVRADKQLCYHAKNHGEGFIVLSGRKVDLKELEVCIGRQVPRFPSEANKIKSKHKLIVQKQATEE